MGAIKFIPTYFLKHSKSGESENIILKFNYLVYLVMFQI